jgi:hypothetical protein
MIDGTKLKPPPAMPLEQCEQPGCSAGLIDYLRAHGCGLWALRVEPNQPFHWIVQTPTFEAAQAANASCTAIARHSARMLILLWAEMRGLN